MTVPEATPPTDDYRKVLRNVGLVLIIVGVLDIGWMVYCLVTRSEFRSSFSVFALAAGVLLMRGSLRTARVVALFSTFYFAGSAGGVLLLPIVMRLPLQLAWLYLRLRPLPAIGYLLLLFALLALPWWTYRMLTGRTVLTAMDQQQIDYRHWRSRPGTGFVAGLVLLGILAFLLGGVMRSGAAKQAEAEVKARVGPGYQFFVSSLQTGSDRGGSTAVSATVIAYNGREIRTVPVEFTRRRTSPAPHDTARGRATGKPRASPQ